jgi:hypothetical protein
LSAGIVFQNETFRNLSSCLVLFSYISYVLLLGFFSKTKIMSENNAIFQNAVAFFYDSIFYRFLVIEFLSRLFLIQKGQEWFYMLKASWFYLDANFVGLYLLLSLYFIVLVRLERKHILVHLIFIALSTSRTSMSSALFFLAFLAIIKILPIPSSLFLEKSIVLKTFSICIASIFLFQISELYEFILNELIGVDGSLNTKINLFGEIISYLSTGSFTGIGFGNYFMLYNIWAHSIFNMYLIEGGLLNFILFGSLLVFTFGDSFTGIIILVTIISQGFSVFSYNTIGLGLLISTYLFIDDRSVKFI